MFWESLEVFDDISFFLVVVAFLELMPVIATLTSSMPELVYGDNGPSIKSLVLYPGIPPMKLMVLGTLLKSPFPVEPEKVPSIIAAEADSMMF